ncbi:cell cycle regulator of non-homologous end joining isoform X4 [Trachypithecus francoisi]|uniref:cell cycle regulator of non-homologous end joining isoform X4 n=1 Tax=Trachypithecus francoisi TaxID=54180 RepID=UPI00141AB303|nr:cell cycle regulator of non-homologous end joining isoform X4 [Trachypithecus francoisi]
METLQSETKKRVLPSWLTAQVATKNVAPAKAPKRMRMAAVPVAAARLPATRTVYCMNEAEIVDVALGILIEVTSTTILQIQSNIGTAGMIPLPYNQEDSLA